MGRPLWIRRHNTLTDKYHRQGKENERAYLIDHPETAAQIEAQLRAKLLPGPVEVPLEEPEDSAELKQA